jgi:hypothetical protein
LNVCRCSLSRVARDGERKGNAIIFILSSARAMTMPSSARKTVNRNRAFTTPPRATPVASKTISSSSPPEEVGDDDSTTRQRILMSLPTRTTYSSPVSRGSAAGGTISVVTPLPRNLLSDLHSCHLV